MALDIFTNGPLRTLLRVGGLDVVYRRGALTCAVRLMPADQGSPAQAQQGFVRQWSERDWLGLLADLVLDSVAITPEPGDEILVDVVDGVPGEVWQVAPQANQQCWEPLAANRSGFRVHSIRIQ